MVEEVFDVDDVAASPSSQPVEGVDQIIIVVRLTQSGQQLRFGRLRLVCGEPATKISGLEFTAPQARRTRTRLPTVGARLIPPPRYLPHVPDPT
ncbi:hypothetical protein IU479_27110 [Nocardia abscessus]|uniref:hypothetical protein n=1 Tax=Nocardia abscessus TaxID=120957 RepID=UPI001D2ACB8E|nr:hypothetical protein [Nocardia abscessus]MBF6221770.1 hypothetical protein [Nocardia abscessus]